MLLLVVHTDLSAHQDLVVFGARAGEEGLQRVIDMGAVVAHFETGRARQQTAQRARLARPLRLIIGVEAIIEARVEGPVARQKGLQDKGLEEPGRVREMPFGRARVLIGLRGLILDAERRGEPGRLPARAKQKVSEFLWIRKRAGSRLRGQNRRRIHSRLPPPRHSMRRETTRRALCSQKARGAVLVGTSARWLRAAPSLRPKI